MLEKITTRYMVPFFIIFLSLPLLKLNFSAFAFQDLDIINLLPVSGWIYIIILVCLGFLYFIYGDEKSTIAYTISVFLVLNISYFLAQYPTLAYWDYYMHGKTANQILEVGRIPSAGTTYFSYPGAFLLTSYLALILNIDVLGAEFLLFVVFQVLSLLILCTLFPRKLDLKVKAFGILLVSFTVLMFYRHFCPANYALMLFLLAIKQIFRNYRSKSKKNTVIIMIISFTIILSHPLTSIFLLSAFAVLIIADLMRRPRMHGRNSIRIMFMSVTVFFFAWHIYNAINPLQETLIQFYNSFILHEEAPALTEHINVPLSRWLAEASQITLLISIFKWLTYITLLFWGVICFWKWRQRFAIQLLAYIGCAILLAGLIFTVLPIPWLERIILPSLIVAILTILQGLKESGKKIKFHYLALITILLIPSFAATHPPFQIYSFHPYEYSMFVHEWEITSLSFLNATSPKNSRTLNSLIIASDFQTIIIYSYFDPLSRQNYVSCGSNFTAISVKNPLIFDGNYIIRSKRQEITSFSAQNLNMNFWLELDQKMNDLPYISKVYDNKYSYVFFRP